MDRLRRQGIERCSDPFGFHCCSRINCDRKINRRKLHICRSTSPHDQTKHQLEGMMGEENYNKTLLKLYEVMPERLRPLVLKYILGKEGGEMYSPTLRQIFKTRYNIRVGYGSYGGCFSARNIPPHVNFGSYCSIAPEVKIFRANHPKNTFTTHPLLYNPSLGFVKKDMLFRPSLN